MKHKLLFSIVMAASIAANSQSEKKLTGYAITGGEHGYMNWKTVKLIDLTTGEEIKSIYAAGQPEPELLNARTGKPIVKKDATVAPPAEAKNIKITIKDSKDGGAGTTYTFNSMEEMKTSETFKAAISKAQSGIASDGLNSSGTNSSRNLSAIINSVTVYGRNDRGDRHGYNRGYGRSYEPIVTEEPFATGSTALAYDKKHDRLYYTPMNINQLRYIDLKSKTPKIYYFEDESFGVTAGRYDVGSQITRMVIASDGNGYALSNNNEHLMRFTTGKKPVITDLGGLVDDAANGDISILSNRRGFGGDLIADASENIYLINQGRQVFKIAVESKIATYKGTIEGLPYGYTTNGIMVEEGSKVIVGSSGSDEGYYRVDLNTLQAEKVSTSGSVYKIADLASGNLLFEKEESKEEIMPVLAYQARAIPSEELSKAAITVYPNPVFDGVVKLSFANQPAGEYQVQLMELSGKVISVRNATINSKVQMLQFNLPQSLAKGNYLIKTISDVNKVSVINKLIVE